jgi:putative transposase
MTNDLERYHRRSIRLKGYDYAQEGAYYVTIVAHRHACLFGEVIGGGGDPLVAATVRLSALGEIVRDEWLRSEQVRQEIELDEFVVMPNHIHGIVVIGGLGDKPEGTGRSPGDVAGPGVGATGRSPLRLPASSSPIMETTRPHGPAPRSLAALMAGFKSAVTSRVNAARGTPRAAVWQRNYYEHIIRDEDDLNRIREYIVNNPLEWESDRENPAWRERENGDA